MSNLENKKDLLLNAIKLGMQWESACLAHGLSQEDIDLLADDADFQRRIIIQDNMHEMELLETHNKICQVAEEKGQASPIQWKLERLNPGKWGGKTNVAFEDNIDLSLTIVKNRVDERKD